jgi:mannose-6-phosphate isomerase-like protein (cupin superfamily)
MKVMKTSRRDEFEVLHGTATSQAAMMTLAPGAKSSEGSSNEHAWAEQWLYVVAGEGKATGDKATHALEPGVLLHIEKGEPHEIANTGETPLVTLNIYAPPAYGDDGEPLYGGTKL